jgi:copper chaperone NosL
MTEPPRPLRPFETAAAGSIAALALAIWLGLPAGAFAQRCSDSGRPCCDYCRMIFTEPAYGADLVSPSKARLVFDAVECLAAFWITNPDSAGPMRAMDHDKPGTFIDAWKASYVHSDSLPSPMGMNLTPFASKKRAETVRRRHGGEILTFEQVVALVRSRWYPTDSVWSGRGDWLRGPR